MTHKHSTSYVLKNGHIVLSNGVGGFFVATRLLNAAGILLDN